MPEFYIKKGLADVELKQWINDNKDEEFIRVDIDVESKADRIRRSFHALIKEWFDCGEWSANGSEDIRSYDKLRLYYILEGSQGAVDSYSFRNNKYRTREEVLKNVSKADLINVESNKSWTTLKKDQKSRALDCLLTEIKMSMCNNQKVLYWVQRITKEFI